MTKLFKSTALCLFFFVCGSSLSQLMAQGRQITGTVTSSENKQPVAGVTVTVKGTNVATLSAQDGTYQINVSDKNATLVFSAVGYKSQEVKAKGRTTINVTLKSFAAT